MARGREMIVQLHVLICAPRGVVIVWKGEEKVNNHCENKSRDMSHCHVVTVKADITSSKTL